MQFEFDPDKSASNAQKHDISFDEAQKLWADPDYLELQATNTDEPRSMIIGKIGEKHWSAIVTYRGESIRLISVRR